MTHLNIFGDRYMDDEPCFLTTMEGTLVFNRITRDWVNWASLEAKAVAEGHTWQSREVGIPSLTWQLRNSWAIGQRWAPGLDNTQGLPSEVVVNGETWAGGPVGSPAATPPTSWDAMGDATFQVFGSDNCNVYGDPVTGGGMSQTLSVTPGEYYVLELRIMSDTTADTRIGLDGTRIPFGGGNKDGSSKIVAASFQAPASGSVTLEIVTAGGGIASLGFARCYLESELTGGGISTGSGVPTPLPAPDPIHGPYEAGGVDFWINGKTCMIGFDVDPDAEPDLWTTSTQVCESDDLSDVSKMGINAKLVEHGCPPMICITATGKVKKAYSETRHAKDEDE